MSRDVGAAIAPQALEQADDAAAGLEHRRTLVLQGALHAYVASDRQGVLIDCNHAAELIFGRPREALIGARLAELLIPARDRPACEAALARRSSAGLADALERRLELAALRSDGSEFPAEITLSAVEISGEPTFHAFIADITERRRAELAREQALSELAEAQRLAKLGSWSWDTATTRLALSDEAARIFGRDPALGPPDRAELLGWLHPDDRTRVSAAWLHAGGLRDERLEIDFRIHSVDGQLRWLRAVGRPQPGTRCWRGSVQDVTELREAEQEAVRLREHAETIVAAMSEGFLLTVDGRIAAVNDAFCEITQFDRDQLIGTGAPFPFWPTDDPDREPASSDQRLSLDRDTSERSLVRRDGERFDAEITVRAARRRDGAIIGHVTTLRDISHRKRYETELERLARSDPLTGLLNQRVFRERLREEISRARRHRRPLSVAVLDLDHFKEVNDKHGHPAGDEILRQAARRLQRLARDGEHVARIGGEEFAWILPDATCDGAYTAVERARQAITGAPFPFVGTITISAGVCELADGIDAAQLYDNADRALYQAKDQGRNRTVRFAAAPNP